MDRLQVLTPFGPRLFYTVHAVPKGGRVVHAGLEIQLQDAHGEVIDIAPNDGRLVRDRTVGEAPQKQDGWIGYASWKKIGHAVVGFCKSTWRVPPRPTENQAQTQFLFDSIESSGNKAVLLPALQYGVSTAGGGSYWAVACWYQVGSQTYYTAPVEVSPGDLLVGSIESAINLNGGVDYQASFANINDFSAQELVSITVTRIV